MKEDVSNDTDTSGNDASCNGFSLTENQLPNVIRDWISVACQLPADPRLTAFVAAYAVWLADRDYDRLINEGKQPWEESEDADD